MKISALTPLLLITILTGWSHGQTRMISHVTAPNGGFQTTVILSNHTTESQDYRLTPFTADGQILAPVSGNIAAGETQFIPAPDLFSGEVSHFTVGDEDQISLTVAYQKSGGEASPAHVGLSDQRAYGWRIYPGDWDDVIDGVALVNTGTTAQAITVRRMDAQGRVLREVEILPQLAANGKGLYLFEEDFSNGEESYFEVTSSGLTALTALRFARDADGIRYLWENRGEALPDPPPADPRIGQTAVLIDAGSYGVSGTATIISENTIRVENFNYNGMGAQTRLVLGMDRDYRNGFAVSEPVNTGTPFVNETMVLTLPEGKTLDDFNSISVYCIDFAENFGDGAFEP